MKRVLAILICIVMLTNPCLAAFATENAEPQGNLPQNEAFIADDLSGDEELAVLIGDEFAEEAAAVGEEGAEAEENSAEEANLAEAFSEEDMQGVKKPSQENAYKHLDHI